MDAIILKFFENLPTLVLVLIAAISLVALAKGADSLVDEAVSLSVHWGIPKLVIGATIVSLGTTLPEATVSVFAAIKGNPDLALGNAIGSIIVNAGLILGIAAMIGKLPVDKKTMNRQGVIQICSAFLLTIVALPLFTKSGEGNVHQWMGFIFIGLLVAYLYLTMKWARRENADLSSIKEERKSVIWQIIKLFISVAVVILSSKILIPSVEVTAIRIGIPQSIIAATIIAFGTSLPELMTAISSVKKGHGELAVGNIIGANILNVLFVVGAAASVTVGGLRVPVNFYQLQFPTMLLILLLFNVFARTKDAVISKLEGLVLVVIYLVYLILNYVWII